MEKIDNRKLPMNLQLFAESSDQPKEDMNSASFRDKVMNFINGGGQTAPPQQAEQPQAPIEVQPAQAAPVNTDNVAPQEQPQQSAEQPSQNEGQSETPQGQETLPVDSNGLYYGKFKSPDEVIKAYGNLEAMNTKTRMELADNKEVIGQLQGLIQQMKETYEQQQQAPGTVEEAQSETEQPVNPEDFMNKWYENPQATLNDMVAKIVQQAVQQNIQPLTQQINPIIQEREVAQKQAAWNKAVNEFASTHNDFGNFTSDMQNILNTMPELGNHPKGVEIIYAMAKGNQYKEPNQILSDENFVNNNILKNDGIKQKIITDYLQSVKKDGQAPVVIAGQPGGDIQLTPENKPKTMEEANAALLKMLGQG